MEYPIADGDQILGFLAVGPGRTISRADRQIILTVCTLLAIKARERQAAVSATATLTATAAKLLLQGQSEAARSLAEEAGLGALPARVRILALETDTDDDVDVLVKRAAALPRSAGLEALEPDVGQIALRHHESGVVYLILNQRQPSRQSAAPAVEISPGSSLKAVLSDPVSLSKAASTMPILRVALSRAPAGMLVGTTDEGQACADQWMAALADYSGADLVGTVAAYLRHRGHWENASRELGLHRNSVRNRISIAASLLGVDLDDADVAAPLWLALRRHNG